MTGNRLAGHAMPHEGAPLRWSPRENRVVVDHDHRRTRCECGEWSPELPSDYARKRWHREHKAGIRGTS